MLEYYEEQNRMILNCNIFSRMMMFGEFKYAAVTKVADKPEANKEVTGKTDNNSGENNEPANNNKTKMIYGAAIATAIATAIAGWFLKDKIFGAGKGTETTGEKIEDPEVTKLKKELADAKTKHDKALKENNDKLAKESKDKIDAIEAQMKSLENQMYPMIKAEEIQVKMDLYLKKNSTQQMINALNVFIHSLHGLTLAEAFGGQATYANILASAAAKKSVITSLTALHDALVPLCSNAESVCTALIVFIPKILNVSGAPAARDLTGATGGTTVDDFLHPLYIEINKITQEVQVEVVKLKGCTSNAAKFSHAIHKVFSAMEGGDTDKKWTAGTKLSITKLADIDKPTKDITAPTIEFEGRLTPFSKKTLDYKIEEFNRIIKESHAKLKTFTLADQPALYNIIKEIFGMDPSDSTKVRFEVKLKAMYEAYNNREKMYKLISAFQDTPGNITGGDGTTSPQFNVPVCDSAMDLLTEIAKYTNEDISTITPGVDGNAAAGIISEEQKKKIAKSKALQLLKIFYYAMSDQTFMTTQIELTKEEHLMNLDNIIERYLYAASTSAGSPFQKLILKELGLDDKFTTLFVSKQTKDVAAATAVLEQKVSTEDARKVLVFLSKLATKQAANIKTPDNKGLLEEQDMINFEEMKANHQKVAKINYDITADLNGFLGAITDKNIGNIKNEKIAPTALQSLERIVKTLCQMFDQETANPALGKVKYTADPKAKNAEEILKGIHTSSTGTCNGVKIKSVFTELFSLITQPTSIKPDVFETHSVAFDGATANPMNGPNKTYMEKIGKLANAINKLYGVKNSSGTDYMVPELFQAASTADKPMDLKKLLQDHSSNLGLKFAIELAKPLMTAITWGPSSAATKPTAVTKPSYSNIKLPLVQKGLSGYYSHILTKINNKLEDISNMKTAGLDGQKDIFVSEMQKILGACDYKNISEKQAENFVNSFNELSKQLTTHINAAGRDDNYIDLKTKSMLFKHTEDISKILSDVKSLSDPKLITALQEEAVLHDALNDSNEGSDE